MIFLKSALQNHDFGQFYKLKNNIYNTNGPPQPCGLKCLWMWYSATDDRKEEMYMLLNKYAKVSRKTLISALGAMRETVIHKTYAPSPEVCVGCKHLGQPNFDCAMSCPYKGKQVELTKTVYRYEAKKSDSNQRTLSLISIKTLVLLLMLTKNGGINDFDPDEAAINHIHCCSLSVKNSLKQLMERGYILYQKDAYSGLYTILILNYAKDLNTHDGYITINKCFLETLMDCESIISAKALLRSYEMTFDQQKHSASIKLYYKEFLSGFPKGVSKNKLINAFSKMKDNIRLEFNKKSILLHFSSSMNAEAAYKAERMDVTKHINEFVTLFNKNIDSYISIINKLNGTGLSNTKREKLSQDIRNLDLYFTGLGFKDHLNLIKNRAICAFQSLDKEINDFTNIAIAYGKRIFNKAFVTACEEAADFTNGTGQIRSRGAFLRSIAIDIIDRNEEINNSIIHNLGSSIA